MEQGVGRERADPLSEIGRQVRGKRSGAKEAPDSSALALLTAPIEASRRAMMTSPTAGGGAGLAWPQRLQTLAPARRRPPQDGVEWVTRLMATNRGWVRQRWTWRADR